MQSLRRAKNKYRYTLILLRQLVISDFKVRYQGSILGYVWSFLRPSALFIILYIVFGQVLKIGNTIPNYSLYLLFGVVLWNFFSEITTGSVGSVVAKGDLMRKLNFPRYVIVLASSISSLINLFLNLFVISAFAIFKGIDLQYSDLLVVPLIIELYLFGLALAFLLSGLYVRYRDVSYIWEVLMQAAFYATPVIYPLSLAADRNEVIAKIISLSPVTQVIQDIRYLLVAKETMTVSSLYQSEYVRILPILVVLLSLTMFGIYFKRRSRFFAEEV